MKKLVAFLFVMALTVPMVASADANEDLGMRQGSYGMAGCGLGSMVFESNSTTSQIFAATTNGTFGSQTFGITTGTSNCSKDGVAKIDKEKEMFVAMNFETLSKEMAQGEGETLNTFASLMGCEGNAFGSFTQANYDTFSKAGTPEALLSTVDSEIKADDTMSKSCSQKI